VTLTVRRTGPGFRAIQPPRVLPTRLPSGRVVRFDGFFDSGRTLGLSLYARSTLRFVAPGGRPFPARKVASVRLRSDTGAHVAVSGAVTPPLRASRVVLTRDGPRSRPMAYAVDSVGIAGGNVVNRAQQRFFPLRDRRVRVPLLLHTARFVSRDALFHRTAGTALMLRYPDGHVLRLPLRDGAAEASDLPRGPYRVQVVSSGYSTELPIWLSRDQVVDVQVISYVDLTVILGALTALGLGLLLVGRPTLRRRLSLRR
jgi:hypothetical protein